MTQTFRNVLTTTIAFCKPGAIKPYSAGSDYFPQRAWMLYFQSSYDGKGNEPWNGNRNNLTASLEPEAAVPNSGGNRRHPLCRNRLELQRDEQETLLEKDKSHELQGQWQLVFVFTLPFFCTGAETSAFLGHQHMILKTHSLVFLKTWKGEWQSSCILAQTCGMCKYSFSFS